MIQDNQTNKVYLAKGLSYYMPLSMLIVENLKCHGIDFAWLPRTENDNYIWARDYMPIQLEKNLFLQYQYNPDYLKRYRGWIPPYKAICKDLGLNCITTDIVMDGGNVIQCGNKVIMTDKIFKENPQYSREALVDELENLFFAELVIIPWDRYEMYGHADGMVRWIDGDRVLINNYCDFDPSFRKKLVEALSPHFQVEELVYNCPRPSKFSWAFLNYLEVKDCIFVPWMPISEAHDAMSRMNELFPDKTVRHIGPFEDIVHMGAHYIVSAGIFSPIRHRSYKKKHKNDDMINEQYIASRGLKECLYAFCGAGNGLIDAKMFALKTEFFHLAQKMLYGGFLQVGDDYEIYIRTVEFYYHEEEVSENQIQDPIVYHRNGRFPGRDLPPFPMMCLHAHWSGYDITFEDSCGRYRASALIREFAVFDRHAGEHGSWVYWFTGEDYGDGCYKTVPEPKFDDRSTYLQFFLNGFSIDGTANRVIWKDFKSPEYGQPTVKTRRNVFQDKEKKVPCDRPWAYRRDDLLYSLR